MQPAIKTSESTDKFWPDFFAAKRALSSEKLVKSAEGLGYSYLPLDDLLHVVTPILLDHNIVVVPTSVWTEDHMTSIVTRFQHVSGQWMEVATPLMRSLRWEKRLKVVDGQQFNENVRVSTDDPQSQGGLLTYGRRYGIVAGLSLPVDDDDAEGVSYDRRQEEDTHLPSQEGRPVRTVHNRKSKQAGTDGFGF